MTSDNACATMAAASLPSTVVQLPQRSMTRPLAIGRQLDSSTVGTRPEPHSEHEVPTLRDLWGSNVGSGQGLSWTSLRSGGWRHRRDWRRDTDRAAVATAVDLPVIGVVASHD